MIAKVACAALHGVEAFHVDLEVDLTHAGIPAFTMVGLVEGAVREARERVFSALRNSGHRIPPSRITVNLAPADRRKDGSGYDLPLAVALLSATGALDPEKSRGLLLAGELSLTGALKPVPGVLPMAILARKLKAKGIIVPRDNSAEAAVVEGLTVYGASSLGEAIAILSGAKTPEATHASVYSDTAPLPLLDFAEVKGQEHAKRAIEIAAAGGHNLLFLGPPGSGKTMLAQRIPTVLPPLAFEEALEVSTIYSVAGMLGPDKSLMRTRPFRAPHHTISHIGLVGGGTYPRPGEVSLAHRGVLFLDELPEFRKQALETLRQPLEDGKINISRAAAALTYPANFMLVAAMNPCPCGYSTDPRRACTCSGQDVQRYRAKISGPLLDRIDMHVEVPAVAYTDLQADALGESSATMYVRILKAHQYQAERYATPHIATEPHCHCNADLSGSLLEQHCRLDREGRDFLGEAVSTLALSARAYTRILRIARTIADLAEEDAIRIPHLAEAVNCRILDRRGL